MFGGMTGGREKGEGKGRDVGWDGMGGVGFVGGGMTRNVERRLRQ